jgi:hypothetical protein
MKYFGISHQLIAETDGKNVTKTYPSCEANLSSLSTLDKADLVKIENGEKMMRDTPFNYFQTMYWSEEEREIYEWILLDIYTNIGNMGLSGILVSEKSKQLLEQFSLSAAYSFYPADFVYKGESYNYYLFATNQDFLKDMLVPEKSEFWLRNLEDRISLIPYSGTKITIDNYLELDNEYYEKGYDFRLRKAIVREKLDYYSSRDFFQDFFIVSERLKNAIEAAGFEGIEFKELDIEFEVLE